MRIRWIGWSLGLIGVLGLVACTVVSSDENPAGTGGSAGAGGNADGGTGGGGGSAGATNNGACGDISVNGACADDQTLKTCVIPETNDPTANPEYVLTKTCAPGTACTTINGIAQCKLLGECAAGDISCTYDQTKLRTCEGTDTDTHWVDTPCDTANSEKCIVPKPGEPARCQVVPSNSGGNGPRMTGRIQYEYRKPTKTGWSNVEVQDATDVYVAIFDNGEMIGKALSGYDPDTQQFLYDGSFKADLTRAPTDATEVWVWPMAFNYDTGQPLMAVAKLVDTDVLTNAETSNAYWAFGTDVGTLGKTVDGNVTNVGDWTITEAEGSGALNIYRWIDYGLLRTANGISPSQHSLIVYWNPETGTPSCGACFCGPSCGGGKVKYGDGPNDVDQYDSWIALGGPSNDGSTEWARAVISHEFGHYVMMNYSASPGEGGPHYVAAASKPGLAYSEGWATSFGMTNVGSPVYIDQQDGTFFWVDLSKYDYSGGPLEKPDPNGAIDQYINENVVAGMIWKLWVDQSLDPDGRNLGDDKIFATLTNPKLVDGTYNRGYYKVDLVDFLDSAICSGSATVEDVASVTGPAQYPYNPAAKPCP
jgi:hypothetical protein